MYRRIDGDLRMTSNDAAAHFPDEFILIQRDSRDFNTVGAVLYVGDDDDELFSLMMKLDTPLGLVVEGLNHRRSLGGIVVGT